MHQHLAVRLKRHTRAFPALSAGLDVNRHANTDDLASHSSAGLFFARGCVAQFLAGLAQHLGRCEGEGVQSAVFLIGGSYGLPKVISKRADVQLSLSAMTLPHRLARLLLAEQVYRGFTILRNEPYSH